MAILVADSIAKSFGERRVLSAASLRAVPGQVRALLGRNGSGKSTLLRVACGLMAADSGVVRFAGKAYRRARLGDLARLGLFLLPDQDLLSRAFSVRMQLESIRIRYDGAAVETIAERVGIAAHLDRRPQQLSSGERRRAEIAAALVRRPVCLVADEPFRGISPLDAEVLQQAFRGLASGGCAVVITGHELPTLLACSDHITWCVAGTTHELGRPAEAMRHDPFAREYVGKSVASRRVVVDE
jgi:ABC-type multidrug transport system ATPase subunit